jgi:GTP cyclohydrolase II
VAAKILGLLKIRSLRLLTNNPDKITKLKAEGVAVRGRIPLIIEPNPYDKGYLDVKREKMGHLL